LIPRRGTGQLSRHY